MDGWIVWKHKKELYIILDHVDMSRGDALIFPVWCNVKLRGYKPKFDKKLRTLVKTVISITFYRLLTIIAKRFFIFISELVLDSIYNAF